MDQKLNGGYPKGIDHSFFNDWHRRKINQKISLVDIANFFCDFVDLFNGFVGTFKAVVEKGLHPPNEIQLGEYSSVGSKNQNMGIGSPCRYLKSGVSTVGQCANGFGLNVIGNMYRMITNRFGYEPHSSDVWGFLRNRNQF